MYAADAPGHRAASAGYMRLVRAFPLRPVRTDAELAVAQRLLDALLRLDLDADGRDYLDVLTDLVERYEREAHPVPDAPAADVLRLLMASNGLTVAALSAEAGVPPSTLSAALDGTGALTRDQIANLAKRFNVSPAAFLPRGDSRGTA